MNESNTTSATSEGKFTTVQIASGTLIAYKGTL